MDRRDFFRLGARRAASAASRRIEDVQDNWEAVTGAPDREPAEPRETADDPVEEAWDGTEAPDSPLSEAEAKRYESQLSLAHWGPDAQLALADASVVVIGLGGLGAPAATYLVAAGVGRVGVLDGDEVRLGHLQRQWLHQTPDLGRRKVDSATSTLRAVNPEVVIDPYPVPLTDDNAYAIVEGHDVVIDASNRFETRYLVNDACCEIGTSLVTGEVAGWTGELMTILPDQSACLRCAKPGPPVDGEGAGDGGDDAEPESPPGVETGPGPAVVGPAAGVIGAHLAGEALKLMTGIGEPLTDRRLVIDLAEILTSLEDVPRRSDCPACGARARGGV